MNRKIGVVMGSDSDYDKMKAIIPVLQENNIDYDYRVISAHRTPDIAAEFAKNAKSNGYDLIIAGAGMSAHLAGVLAAFTGVPIIGLPIKSNSSGMNGMDALHSVIQMPPGIPVATVGIDNAKGAANLAVHMIDCYDVNLNNSDKPIVDIIYNNKVSEADLEKAIDTFDIYEIGYKIIDLSHIKIKETTSYYDVSNADEVIKELDLDNNNNVFAILNLTNINIEEIIQNDKFFKKIPIVQVPMKALTDDLNDTSNKIYYQTQASESVAFVGVNGYKNGALLIGRIVGIHNQTVYDKIIDEHSKLATEVIEKDLQLSSKINEEKLKYK